MSNIAHEAISMMLVYGPPVKGIFPRSATRVLDQGAMVIAVGTVIAVSLGGCGTSIRPDDAVKDAASAVALANAKCPAHEDGRFYPSDVKLEGDVWRVLKVMRTTMLLATIEKSSGEVTECIIADKPEY